MRLGSSLLGIEANGSHYFIARDLVGGGLWLADRDADGGAGASPLGELSGASTEPFDSWIVAGIPPPGTRRVEVESESGKRRARFRNGMWTAAVPTNGSYLNFTVRFLDSNGTVVETREGDAYVPSRSRA